MKVGVWLENKKDGFNIKIQPSGVFLTHLTREGF